MEELDVDSMRDRFSVSILIVSESMNLSMPSRRASSTEASLILFMDSREHIQS